MKTYTYFKNKIHGYEDVSETVKTIEKIAASGVHTIRKEITALNTYVEKTQSILSRLSRCTDHTATHPLMKNAKSGKSVLIVLTGEKGLVGGLWHTISEQYQLKKTPEKYVIIVGTKGYTFIPKKERTILTSFSFTGEVPSHSEVSNLLTYLTTHFYDGTFKDVSILYPRFISLGEQHPVCVPFFPFEANEVYNTNTTTPTHPIGMPIFETKTESLFTKLMELFIQTRLYSIVLETKLSELSARTVAMEHAAQKTKELVSRLHTQHARQRRQIATQKQLESFSVQKIL